MALVQHAPRFSTDDAARLAQEYFGIGGVSRALPSERDQNFLVRTGGGDAYVLKIANGLEVDGLIYAQQRALRHLASYDEVSRLCPQVVLTTRGEDCVRIEGPDGRQHWLRMLTFVPGTPVASVRPHTPVLMASIGRAMGELDRALATFDDPALHREFHWDLAQAATVINQAKGEIGDPARRALVERHLARFEHTSAPLLTGVRRGIIHGDANDYNLLAGDGDDLATLHQSISGILDFGDMVWSYLAGDLAIAAAYALLDKPDPLATVMQVTSGYHAVFPLEEVEIAVLWDLICMRLCMSVCHAAYQRRLEPQNEYLSVSERPAWDALHRLDGLNAQLAHYALRDACGLEPCPRHSAVVSWLQSGAAQVAPIVDGVRPADKVAVVDLSVGSTLLTPQILLDGSAAALSAAIDGAIRAQGATVGIGGNDEVRAIYAGAAFALDENPTGPRRTVHLGVDIFAPAGTTVYAPLGGVVHAATDNTAYHDYGPVILLRHETGEGEPFFTLYGHLSRESLAAAPVGRKVQAGDYIGTMGAAPINGDWPPHLHFQIIIDPLGLDTDFPGVAAPALRTVMRSLSPDPNLLLRLPPAFFPAPGRTKAETLRERQQRIGYNLSISYRKPLKIVRGLGVYLYDEEGRPFLDCVNNVAHVGHCHPHVVAAGQRQMAVLNTNTRYLHDSMIEYAERLTATLPPQLSVCFFVNSGSEANDLALRLARAATGAFDMITLDVAYHGHTQALIEVSPYKHDGPGGRGRPPFVQKVIMPDPYRGPYYGYSSESGRAYADHVRAAADEINAQGRGVAGLIAESLMGCGGQLVFPDGFLQEAFAGVRAAGGICIADEVQTGFGRVGTHYWGFETQSAIPDIVTTGKPAGNGHPLAAVITTPEIARKFANGMEYFNTFGGNPVSCAIGMAVLDVIEQEHLQANALDVGNYLMARLRALMPVHPIIGDVRGLGLYIGIELVLDRETQIPAGDHASYIANRMRDLGVLISTDGPFHNVLKIKPPIVFSRANADHLVDSLALVLGEDAVQVG